MEKKKNRAKAGLIGLCSIGKSLKSLPIDQGKGVITPRTYYTQFESQKIILGKDSPGTGS